MKYHPGEFLGSKLEATRKFGCRRIFGSYNQPTELSNYWSQRLLTLGCVPSEWQTKGLCWNPLLKHVILVSQAPRWPSIPPGLLGHSEAMAMAECSQLLRFGWLRWFGLKKPMGWLNTEGINAKMDGLCVWKNHGLATQKTHSKFKHLQNNRLCMCFCVCSFWSGFCVSSRVYQKK